MDTAVRQALQRGLVIPAHPLALTARRQLDERRQRGLSRYYLAAGAGGLAVAVHTTQFAIRDGRIGLLRPVLQLAAEEMLRERRRSGRLLIGIGGICGATARAATEAAQLRELGYHAGLLSLAAMSDASEEQLLTHCREVARILPVMGFYLQPAVGGRVLTYSFWRRFCEIENVVAIKIAPFNRYQTLDVVRAVVEAGRDDIALYTGNDDNIVLDLLTPHRLKVGRRIVERRIVGGLLGHWAVWTRRAAGLLDECHRVVQAGSAVSPDLLAQAIAVTDCNGAFFDAANGFRGCIAGLHEVLRRQGLLAGSWCLDPQETLSPGQKEQIDRVESAYPDLNDNAFVTEHREQWLRE